MLMKRAWGAFGMGAVLLALAPAQALAQDLTLGQLAVAGLEDVCVPVIERGEAIGETASGAGFIELEGENRAALGGGPGMSWWFYEFAGALLVVGRDLDEAGSPCQILANSDAGLSDGIDGEIGNWLNRHRSGYELVRTPKASDGPDALWVWERVGGGTVQQLQMNVTRRQDSSASSMLRYRLLPQPR
ncbi:MAG TPA: hypothetical protein PKD99_07665 [Sphingopyxis sp.]|nr:hypothetical protein [Sphingopyxis sp.]HMP44966.1 hypothetical protein [Sphingopyxis sp.]HMQ20516.1 hypothetical protein [Sphingopyxis sp.]